VKTDLTSPERSEKLNRQFGRAWLVLALALALHVTDEALTGFLNVYNPTVAAIRARVPWLPLPTFTFWPWLCGLVLAITILLALSPRARRGSRWIVATGVPLSVIMIANGLGHIGGSFYMGRFMPGVYSSPALIAASLFTLVLAVRLWRIQHRTA